VIILQHFGKHCSCRLQGASPAAKTQVKELDKINSECWILFATFTEGNSTLAFYELRKTQRTLSLFANKYK
jgi:hypothetical protein